MWRLLPVQTNKTLTFFNADNHLEHNRASLSTPSDNEPHALKINHLAASCEQAACVQSTHTLIWRDMGPLTMPKLTIIRGLPGTGKTTRAAQLAAETGALHLEADQWYPLNRAIFSATNATKAHRWCSSQCEEALQAGRDVIVSNTFTRLWEMSDYVLMANEIGAQLEVIELKHEYGAPHISTEKMQQMRDRWEALPAGGLTASHFTVPTVR